MKPNPAKEVTLTVGQAVPWKPSRCGFAQICELRRTKVRLCYRTKHGRIRFALAKAHAVCANQLLFEMDNPFNRGRIVRRKTFVMREVRL